MAESPSGNPAKRCKWTSLFCVSLPYRLGTATAASLAERLLLLLPAFIFSLEEGGGKSDNRRENQGRHIEEKNKKCCFLSVYLAYELEKVKRDKSLHPICRWTDHVFARKYCLLRWLLLITPRQKRLRPGKAAAAASAVRAFARSVRGWFRDKNGSLASVHCSARRGKLWKIQNSYRSINLYTFVF